LNARVYLPVGRRSDLDRDPEGSQETAIDLLRELISEVRGLRQDIARGQRPVMVLNRADRALLARLLPAVGGVFGSELFLTRELFESDAAALKLVTRGLNALKVGRALRRGEGQAIDGYSVQREGTELNTVLWRVVQVDGFPADRNLTVPPQPTRGRVQSAQEND
jgi:hypothetical protein